MSKKLYRSKLTRKSQVSVVDSREYTGIDSTIWRIIFIFLALPGGAPGSYPVFDSVGRRSAKRKRLNEMQPMIIDVREPFEFATSHVKGAVNIPMGKFENGKYKKKLAGAGKDDEFILYCRSGARAGSCAMAMAHDGFMNVKNGINEATVRRTLGI